MEECLLLYIAIKINGVIELNKYEWAVEDIYPSIKEWEEDYKKAKELNSFDEFKGNLDKVEVFLSCMKKQENVGRLLEKLYVYAMMLSDSDTANAEYGALLNRCMALSSEIGANTAFVVPELTSLSIKVIEDYIADKSLSEYDYFLKGVLKDKAHVLDEKSETIMARASETLSSFKEIFTKIDNADLPLKSVRDGKEVIPLSHGAYSVILHGKNRNLRKRTFKSYYGSYLSLINTITSTYYGSVKADVFRAKVRNYSSALNMALSGEDVGEEVYYNLINSVREALPTLHEYIAEKKKALKLKKMHTYDMYVPVVEDAELELEYDDAYNLVIDGLSVLGDEYVNLLKKAREYRWISVYEKKGKRSGAYSVAVYDTHPYVLLNYQKTTHDVFTIAHEMGHSIHSYYSNKNQPYAKADYKIFVAEVASTVNEVLLLKYLLKKTTDVKLKKYLLSYLMEMIRTTLFRQTQFAEFEEFSHSEVEKGEPLTKTSMSDKYLELNKKYYGDAVISDEEIKYEWARIPHFYRAFYVYKYATGIISALSIADRILTEGESAVKDYFKFLSSGGSDSPVELLKIAGVDLTKEQPFKSAFKVFSDALDEFKRL